MSQATVLDLQRFVVAVNGPVVRAEDWRIAGAAQEVIEQARQVLAQARQEVEQARARGRDEGLAAGRSEALAGFADELMQVRRLKEDLGRRHEDAIVDLATAIVARIAPQLGAETLVPAIAAEAARAATGDRYLIIRVAPAAASAVRAAAEGWRRLHSSGAIEVIADDALADFDCLLETEVGIIRAGLDEQLDAIREVLRASLDEAAIAEEPT